MAANVLTATAINADAITAAKLAADVTTELQTGLATAASIATAQADLDILTGADGVVIASGTQTFNMTGNITGNLSGSVGSVTGAVGSVTGNVGGNVAGSVGSVTGAVGSVTGNVGGNVAGSVGSVTAEVTPTAASKTGYRLSATGVTDISTAVWAFVMEGTWTAIMYMRLIASGIVAKLSGAGTTTVTIRDVDDTKDRIVATVDADGNRSAFGTRDGT
jgi:uncharacterized protein YjbJ (UPF0337 family)